MAANASPELTIVLSTIDPRGVFERAVTSWTARQTAEPGRFQLVVAGAADEQQARVLRTCLRPGDRWVAAGERDAGSQWARGAAAAVTRFLLFTEAHCVAAPGCVAEVLDRFADSGADVLALSCPGTTGTTLEWLDERFCRSEVAARPAPARAVSPRAFAIRRRVYEALGGIEAGLGAFADVHLARRVLDAGVRVADAPRAGVLHHNVPTLEQPVFCVRDYVTGEVAWRRRVPEARAWDTFGVRPILACRGDRDPRHQAAARRALWAVCRRAVGGRRPQRSLRTAVRALRGWRHLARGERHRGRRELALLDRRVAEARAALATAGRDARGQAIYLAYWRALAEQAEARLVAEGRATSELSGSASDPIPSDRLFGLSAPLRGAVRWDRYVRGVGGVRLPAGAAEAGLAVELEPGARSGPVLVLWNGRVLGSVPPGVRRFEHPGALGPATPAGGDDVLVLVDLEHPEPKWHRTPRVGRDVVLVAVARTASGSSLRYVVSPRRSAVTRLAIAAPEPVPAS